jgi:hypothetical protein
MRETYIAKQNGKISHLSFIKFAISHGRSKPLPYDKPIYLNQDLWDDGVRNFKENLVVVPLFPYPLPLILHSAFCTLHSFPSSLFPVAKRLYLRNLYLNLTACLGGTGNSVENCLIVDDLACGNGSFAAV